MAERQQDLGKTPDSSPQSAPGPIPDHRSEQDIENIPSRLLGEIEQTAEGAEYIGRFIGTGWITGRHDDGSFLSNVLSELTPPDEKTLFMGDLFPEDWEGEQVEYEITVRAKRVTDQYDVHPILSLSDEEVSHAEAASKKQGSTNAKSGEEEKPDAFAWLKDEPDIYTLEDGEPVDIIRTNPTTNADNEGIHKASSEDDNDLDEDFGIPTLSLEQSRELFEKSVQQSLGISTAEFVAGFKRGEYDFSHDRPKHWAIAEVLGTLPFIAADLDQEALQMAHEVLGWPEPKTPDRQERVEQVKESFGTAEVAEDYKPFQGSPDVQDKS